MKSRTLDSLLQLDGYGVQKLRASRLTARSILEIELALNDEGNCGICSGEHKGKKTFGLSAN